MLPRREQLLGRPRGAGGRRQDRRGLDRLVLVGRGRGIRLSRETRAWGYWLGCYAAAVVAAVVAGVVFSRLFDGPPLYWILGTLGLLLGSQAAFFSIGGRVGEGLESGSDQFVVAIGAIVGLGLGFAVAHAALGRRKLPRD